MVTGAYYLSLAYGRGSWPELVATSMIPLIVACGLKMVRRGASPGLILLLAASTCIWSGSHNLTFALGTVFLFAIAVCLLIVRVGDLTKREMRRFGAVLLVTGLGVMLNGWYLLPDIAYSLHTQIAQYRTLAPTISGIFSRFSVVFDPLRERATGSTYLRSHFTQVPVLVIAWLVVAVASLWSKWDKRLPRLVPLLFLILIALLLLLIDEEIWHRLPSTFSLIQFTFRLQTYIVLTLAGLTIVILRAMRERTGGSRESRLDLALVAIVLLGLGLGIWQVWNSNAYFSPARVITWLTGHSYCAIPTTPRPPGMKPAGFVTSGIRLSLRMDRSSSIWH